MFSNEVVWFIKENIFLRKNYNNWIYINSE